MQKIPLALILALAAVVLPNTLAAADKTTLFEEAFESPNGTTFHYPPIEGGKFTWIVRTGSGSVAGWSIDGQVGLTYAEKIGSKDSGGLDCKLEKAGGLYAEVNVSDIVFTDVSQTGLTTERISTVKVSFSAKIPNGEGINVSLNPVLPREGPDSAWENRLVFPTILGTGSYETYEFSVADLSEQKIEKFVAVLKSAMDAGLPKAAFNLSLTFAKAWPQGTSYQLDDILVTQE